MSKLHRLLMPAAIAITLASLPLSQVVAVVSNTPAVTETNATRLTNLQTRGAAEITRRLANLNAAQTKLNASTKLSAADKTTLGGEITTEITGLTTLKTKLAADTDLATARTDVQSIVTEYRVYVVMLPETQLATVLDATMIADGNLTTLEGKLQTQITTEQGKGVDMTAEKTSLTDMQTQLASYATATTGLDAAILAVTPTQYNADHSVLTSKRDTLKSAEADLKAAREDASTIITALRALK